ncbi:MAG: MFS transporter [Chloroflexi bacterium]|nr:MFS transporter [Chloroflexota bacterium]
MSNRLQALWNEFPRQFWILFGGTLINSLGNGMVFPFMTLYLHEQLNLSLTLVGFALTLWAGSGVAGQLIGGSLSDQFGRRKLMLFSLISSAILLPIFGLADSFASAAAVAVLLGIFGSMYQPARDAMVADLVGSDKRPQAYGLVRVVSNLGIAIGPAIGGFLATRSYLLAFTVSAAATFAFFLVSVLFIRETRPAVVLRDPAQPAPGTFLSVLSNIPFVVFSAATTFVILAAVQMMTVLPVYMNDQFGLGASYFGWVMTTNAGLVVLFQFPITRATQKLPRLPLMATGALLYAAGVGSVMFGNAFPHFIAAMVIVTLGEMIISPTATSVTADLAPADMRGRYMSVLGLTWTLGFGLGPVLGGIVSDQIAPRALWPAMASAALAGGIAYLVLARFLATREPRAVITPAD